jgi:hypothetical protein
MTLTAMKNNERKRLREVFPQAGIRAHIILAEQKCSQVVGEIPTRFRGALL